MKYEDNIAHVAALQPDCLGFIFYEKSSRFFNREIPKLPESIKKIGVFVNASFEDILEKVNKYALQAIQLHGDESPEFCNKLSVGCHAELDSASNAVEIIKVFSIKEKFNFEVLKPYEDVCDYYLFDTKGKLPGGNGYTFDWSLLNKYPSTKPFFLSGGIGLDQIENIKQLQKSEASKYCYAIDVNSRFEIEAGLKNIGLLKEFKQELSFRN